jgi:hypothetical protein
MKGAILRIGIDGDGQRRSSGLPLDRPIGSVIRVLSILSGSEAENWIDRLRSVDGTERLADRDLLSQG